MDLTLTSATILGLVQGLTEFLPISSSGHLALAPFFFGFEDPGLSFTVALHVGTFFAVVIYFCRDWLNIFGLKRDMPVYQENKKLLWYLILATLPIVIVGGLFLGHIEDLVGTPLFIAGALFLGGLTLYLTDRYGRRERTLADVGVKEALLIGTAQVFAILPGVSRSGITIAMARILGIGRVDAARFSFLLSTPVILGAGVAQADEFLAASFDLAFWIGVITSFVSAYLAIKYLLQLMQRISYAVFFWYSVVLMGIIVVLTINT